MSVAPQPDWPQPPVGGWTAEDLDRLPNLPPHTELLDGSLVFVSPQMMFHMRTMRLLERGLLEAVPAGWDVLREMTIVLGVRNRPEPDLMVVRQSALAGPEQTSVGPEDVLLAVEVVSPDSVERDREVKPRKYAAAGIQYYWRVENDQGSPVIYTYEVDPATRTYAPTGVHRGALKTAHPFPVDVSLDLS
ncbi:Uma2 family endonuclease [Kitasatospora sp. MAA4]|uniref:Uma2 family endonuclease n=1 Tax=Kitasatospora sp. MAA4 TaxID=3035093 RepID=UPI0024748DE0|nr:Uma2 family endonuclease [Kitasatospora sp. MAA4]MDH6133182.1 Uma2 family endonuclease [Kitasatospora sp. MAA4]